MMPSRVAHTLAASLERYPLPDLLRRVKAASRPSRELDAQIEVAMRWLEADAIGLREDVRAPWRARADGTVDDPWTAYPSAPVTKSIDAASALVERMLPGWWWKVGTCHLSDDACIAPDINSPTWGALLKKQLGPFDAGSEFDAGFDVDRRPAGNLPLALLTSLLRALIALQERGARVIPRSKRPSPTLSQEKSRG